MKPNRFLVALLILVTLCLSCKPTPTQKRESGEWGSLIAQPSQAEKIAKQKLWNSKKPKHYRHKLRVACYCGMDTHIGDESLSSKTNFDWLLVEIMDEHIVSVKTFDGKVVTTYTSRADYPNPIEEVFYMIGLQTELGYEKLYAVYDKEFGFPRFYLDTAEKGPGSIFRFEIVEFENLDNEP